MPVFTDARLRSALGAVIVAGTLATVPACSSHKNATGTAAVGATASAPSTADRVKLAKTKFALNASLAAGAAYQWIYKPFKAGEFKKGSGQRTTALVKGGLAGAFTYNRLKAAIADAKGDPSLAKATDALSGAVAGLKSLPAKIKGGTASEADVNQYQNVISSMKQAGAGNGAQVTDKIPSAAQLAYG